MNLGRVAWIIAVVACLGAAVALLATGYTGYSIVAAAVGVAAAVNLT